LMTQPTVLATSRNASWVPSRWSAVALAPRVTMTKQTWNTSGLYSMHLREDTINHSIGLRTCKKASGRSLKSKSYVLMAYRIDTFTDWSSWVSFCPTNVNVE
jgi:hypothetical protein